MGKMVYGNLRYYRLSDEWQNMDREFIIDDKDYEKQNMDRKYIIVHKDYKNDNSLLKPFFGYKKEYFWD